MNDEIKEYAEALKEHTANVQTEVLNKKATIKSRYRLLRASENLRASQRELLEKYN